MWETIKTLYTEESVFRFLVFVLIGGTAFIVAVALVGLILGHITFVEFLLSISGLVGRVFLGALLGWLFTKLAGR